MRYSLKDFFKFWIRVFSNLQLWMHILVKLVTLSDRSTYPLYTPYRQLCIKTGVMYLLKSFVPMWFSSRPAEVRILPFHFTPTLACNSYSFNVAEQQTILHRVWMHVHFSQPFALSGPGGMPLIFCRLTNKELNFFSPLGLIQVVQGYISYYFLWLIFYCLFVQCVSKSAYCRSLK